MRNVRPLDKTHARAPAWLGHLVVIVAALTAVVLGSSAASAGQIDNEGDEGVLVQYSCGVACGTYVGLNGGESIGLPNADGQVQAGVALDLGDKNTTWICEVGDPVTISIDEHLSLVFDWGTKDPAAGKATGKETFTWTSRDDGRNLDVKHRAEPRGGDGSWCWPGPAYPPIE